MGNTWRLVIKNNFADRSLVLCSPGHPRVSEALLLITSKATVSLAHHVARIIITIVRSDKITRSARGRMMWYKFVRFQPHITCVKCIVWDIEVDIRIHTTVQLLVWLGGCVFILDFPEIRLKNSGQNLGDKCPNLWTPRVKDVFPITNNRHSRNHVALSNCIDFSTLHKISTSRKRYTYHRHKLRTVYRVDKTSFIF